MSEAEREVTLPHNGWRPRKYQDRLWGYLENGGLRADACWHRRAGKDELALHWTACALTEKPGTYWHMLPEGEGGRRAIWAAVNGHTGRRRIDEAFPPAIRANTVDDKMFIRFKNGSTWQVLGSDNYNRYVGSPPRGIVFSEWQLSRPEAWQFTRPMLLENGGWALFIWTPRGNNHAVRAFKSRSQDPEWFTEKLSALKTGVFTQAQLDRELKELMDEAGSREEGQARFNSEYMVDFDSATPGSYYGSLIAEAEQQGRICRVPYDPGLKVDTAWDLGIHDYTAIWYFQQAGREVRVIDYYETSGEGLQSIVAEAIDGKSQMLNGKPCGKPYAYGRHYLPHDVAVRELGAAGKSRKETLLGLGVSPIEVGVPQDPEERINASRQLLPICVFDAEACALGLNRLGAYRKRWNKSTSSYVGPLHNDVSSHGADAFGYYAMNRKGLKVTAPGYDFGKKAKTGADTDRASKAAAWLGR